VKNMSMTMLGGVLVGVFDGVSVAVGVLVDVEVGDNVWVTSG